MSETKTSGNGKGITVIEKMSESQMIQQVMKLHDPEGWKVLAQAAKCDVATAKLREIKLLKLSESQRVQTFSRVLKDLRSVMVEELVNNNTISDVPLQDLNDEVKRKNPGLFI